MGILVFLEIKVVSNVAMGSTGASVCHEITRSEWENAICDAAITSESVKAWLSFVPSLSAGAKEQKGTSAEGDA